MPGTRAAGGNILYNWLVAPTLAPVLVANGVSVEQTFTVPGLMPGDEIGSINFQGALTVLVDIGNARVVSANVLGLSFQNATAGSLTPPTGVYVIEVNRSEVPISALPTTAA
jgi:hypothetical protein